MASQLILPILEHAIHPDGGEQEYLVSESNRMTYETVMGYPHHWGTHGLVVVGKNGVGKTLLSRSFQRAFEAKLLNDLEAEAATVDRWLEDAKAVVLELENHQWNEQLLVRLYDLTKARTIPFLITTPVALEARGFRLQDLQTRLSSLRQVSLDEPDDALLAAWIMQESARLQTQISSDVTQYMLRHCKRDISSFRKALQLLVHQSLIAKKPITVPLTKSVLETLST